MRKLLVLLKIPIGKLEVVIPNFWINVRVWEYNKTRWALPLSHNPRPSLGNSKQGVQPWPNTIYGQRCWTPGVGVTGVNEPWVLRTKALSFPKVTSTFHHWAILLAPHCSPNPELHGAFASHTPCNLFSCPALPATGSPFWSPPSLDFHGFLFIPRFYKQDKIWDNCFLEKIDKIRCT